jgi:hypothetical protein
MIISLDTQLDSIDIDLDDLDRLDADEIEAAILAAFPEGLDVDTLKTLKEKILDELDELKDEWKDVLQGERSALADAESSTDKAHGELNIEEIEEALAFLSPFEDSLDAAAGEIVADLDHDKLLNQETADSLSWTSAGLEEGDAVTIKCTGIAVGTGSIWDDGIQRDELTDMIEDGVITYADYEATVRAGHEDVDTMQSLTLGTAGETYSLASVDDGTVTFRVTNAEGKSFLLTIEGSPVIYFSPGVVTLTQIETWPESLTNRCYEVGDTMSFGNHLYADSLSPEEKLAYMDTYEEVMSDANFDAVCKTLRDINFDYEAITHDGSMTTDEVKLVYQESLKILYTSVNDPSSYSSMSAAWADVFQLWDFMGLNANDKRMVTEVMVLGVFQKGGEYFFKAFFQPVATILQNVIFAAGEAAGTNSNELDKMIQILLGTHAGGTSTLWETNFATYDEATERYQSGYWSNHEENIEALELYQSLCANSGWALANATATTAVANEKAMIEQDVADADPDNENPTVAFDSAHETWFYNNAEKYSERVLAGVAGSGTTIEENVALVKSLATELKDLGNIDAATIREAILKFIGGNCNQEGLADQADDFASIFMVMLHDYNSELFWELSRDANWVGDMLDIIDDGEEVPQFLDDLQGFGGNWG